MSQIVKLYIGHESSDVIIVLSTGRISVYRRRCIRVQIFYNYK